MSPALSSFLATGKLLGLECGSSRSDADRALGLADSSDVGVRDGVELRQIYGAGAAMLFFERERLSGIGLYWGSENATPAALRRVGIDTQKTFLLNDLRRFLTRSNISFKQYEQVGSRNLFIPQAGVVVFSDGAEVFSAVRPCGGSLCLDTLVSFEPSLKEDFQG